MTAVRSPAPRELPSESELSTLLDCESERELAAKVGSFAARLGFELWLYAARPDWISAPPFLLGSFPARWLDRSMTSLGPDTDALVAYARGHAAPLEWTTKLADPELARRCPGLLRHPGEYGLASGVSVPLHGLGCQWSLLCAGRSGMPPDGPLAGRQLAGLVLLSMYAHQRGSRFATAFRDEVMHLTARERECLRWAALGKTGWEMSRLLGITPRTVAFHIDNAARKLGVFGRRQAVAKAIALHLIAI